MRSLPLNLPLATLSGWSTVSDGGGHAICGQAMVEEHSPGCHLQPSQFSSWLGIARNDKGKETSRAQGLILMISECLSGLYEKATRASLSDALE